MGLGLCVCGVCSFVPKGGAYLEKAGNSIPSFTGYESSARSADCCCDWVLYYALRSCIYILDNCVISICTLDRSCVNMPELHSLFQLRQVEMQKSHLSCRAIQRSFNCPNSLSSTSIAEHHLNKGVATDAQVGVAAVGASDPLMVFPTDNNFANELCIVLTSAQPQMQ